MLRALEVVAGVLLLAFVASDVFRAVVVPRPSFGPSIDRLVVRRLWLLWRAAGVRQPASRREPWLGAYAPLALLVMVAVWVGGLLLASGLILHALRDQVEPRPAHLGDAVYLAGNALFTLGQGDVLPAAGWARVVVLGTAAAGPSVIALGLTLLFSLVGSFQQRETPVVTLDARAGAPPSGVALLETFGQLGLHDELGAAFERWELWTAEVLDSHRAYPLLAYFRSSHDEASWVSSLGAVLDAATLTLALDVPAGRGQAELLYRTGCHAVEDLAHYFGMPHGAEAGVERAEFDEALGTLARAGFATRDPDAAWAGFAERRAAYATQLHALAAHFASPPARWVGDRAPTHPLHV